MKSILMGLTALILFLGVAVSATADENAEREAIAKQARAFSTAFVAGDTDAMMAIYTPDARIVPTNRYIISAPEKVRAYWTPRADRASQVTAHHTTSEHLDIVADMASDVGYYEGVSVDKAGNEQAFGGAYVIVWRKIDGVWRMQTDMWNSIRDFAK